MVKYKPITDDDINKLANDEYIRIHNELKKLNELSPPSLSEAKTESNVSSELYYFRKKQKTTSSRHHKISQKSLASTLQISLSFFVANEEQQKDNTKHYDSNH